MQPEQFEVIAIDGLRRSDKRGIVFLRLQNGDELNAHAKFAGLAARAARDLRSRFDLWIDGGTCDEYFHGWPSDERYKGCFVFKWKEQRLRHRMYGFLFNPQPKTRPRFQVCVLCVHDVKTAWNTDTALLDTSVTCLGKADVKAAVQKQYPDQAQQEKRQ